MFLGWNSRRGHVVRKLKVCFLILHTHNIKDTSWILPKCRWQDFDALTIQISAAASGRWRNPRIIQPDRDAYWCLSSCIDVPTYCIPFPGDVTYPRRCVCAAGKWHSEAERSRQIRWFAISVQPLVCTFTVSSSTYCWKQKGKREDYRILKMSVSFPDLFWPGTFETGRRRPRCSSCSDEWHQAEWLTLHTEGKWITKQPRRSEGIWTFLQAR